jgi:hypothetical protein
LHRDAVNSRKCTSNIFYGVQRAGSTTRHTGFMASSHPLLRDFLTRDGFAGQQSNNEDGQHPGSTVLHPHAVWSDPYQFSQCIELFGVPTLDEVDAAQLCARRNEGRPHQCTSPESYGMHRSFSPLSLSTFYYFGNQK